MSKKLVYCATPARLSAKKHEIMELVISKGKASLHPFNALPTDYFATEAINRADTLALCCKLVDACDELWLFGISEGTLTEAEYLFSKGSAKISPGRYLLKSLPQTTKSTLKSLDIALVNID